MMTDWNLEHLFLNTVYPAMALKNVLKNCLKQIDHNNLMKKKEPYMIKSKKNFALFNVIGTLTVLLWLLFNDAEKLKSFNIHVITNAS